MRLKAMCIRQMPSRTSAEILVDQLGDRTLTGWDLPYRFCEYAAQRLIGMLGLQSDFGYETGPETRDPTITRLRVWWEEHRDTVDWAALRRKLDQDRAAKQ